jgi:hypothetical protein
MMAKKRDSKKLMDEKIKEVMSLMGQRSAEARQKTWGKREFRKRMKEWGKLGGRPKKSKPDSKQRKETA